MEKDIETSFSRGKLLPSSVPSEKLPGKNHYTKKRKKTTSNSTNYSEINTQKNSEDLTVNYFTFSFTFT